MHRIQREFTAQGATLAKLADLWRFKESIDEEDEDEVKTPESLKNVENLRQTLEDIDHYLDRKRGTDGVPLAYIVRTSVEIPAAAPNYGLPLFEAKMIMRARHG
jgi:hypothetical protein